VQRITGLPDEQVAAFEDQIEAAVRAALDQVMETVARRVEAAMPVLAGALVAADPPPVPPSDGLPPGQPYVSPDDLASIPPLWQTAVEQQILPIVAQVFMSSVGHVHTGMVDASNIPALPSVGSFAAEQYLAQAQNTFDQIGDSLWSTARTQLSEGFEAGESIPQLATRLRDSAGVTARTGVLVARTQVIEASNAGSFATAQASGLAMKKFWIATDDLRTRPEHLDAESNYSPGGTPGPIDLNEPFIVGGFSAMFPAAPSLPPSMRFNCRCTQGYVMPDQAITKMRENLAQQQAQEELPGTEGPLTQFFPKATGPGFDEPARGAFVDQSYVRPTLRGAKTPRELRRVWQDEVSALTGFPFQVAPIPADISMVTAREYAEGTLQMFAQFPEARMDRIVWFNDPTSSSYAQVRRGGHAIEINMRYASEKGRTAFLAARRRDVAGWDTGDTSWSVRNDVSGQGVMYHEFTHILDLENTRDVVASKILPILLQHSGTDTIEHTIATRISSYAASDKYNELIAEAGTDVMVNGAAASQLSRDIFDVLRAEYRARGFGLRTGPVGEVFPKVAGPRPVSSMTVADLRAELKAAEVAIPPGARKADLTRLVEDQRRAVPGERVGVSPPAVAPTATARLATMKVGELRDLARARGVEVSAKARKVDLVKALSEPTPPIPSAATAVARQAVIDEQRAVADALSEARQLLDRQASARALASRADAIAARTNGVQPLVDAMRDGDAAAIRRAVDDLAARRGLVEVGSPPAGQDWVAFNPQVHEVLPGLPRPAAGAYVRITKPAYRADINGEQVQLGKAVVEPLDAAEIKAIQHAPAEAARRSIAVPERVAAQQAELRRIVDTPLAGQPHRIGGSGAINNMERHEGGTVITKDYSRNSAAMGVRDADAEELGALVMDALDVPTQTVLRTGDRSIVVSVLEGEHPEAIGPLATAAQRTALAQTDGGRLLGLADTLIGNADRRRNWVRLADGRPASYDLGGAFRAPKLAAPADPEAIFARFLSADGKAWARSIDMNPADLAVIRTRLEALRPEFERLGRATWHRQVMARLVEVEKRADPAAPLRLATDRAAQRAAVRTRAAKVQTQRANAALTARVEELLQAKASKAVIRQELDPALREAEQLYAGADPALAGALRTALDSGDTAKLRAALSRQTKASGITPIGKAGGKAKFDPATMEGVGGTHIPDGVDVVVVRRGARIDGVDTPERAIVRATSKPLPQILRDVSVQPGRDILTQVSHGHQDWVGEAVRAADDLTRIGNPVLTAAVRQQAGWSDPALTLTARELDDAVAAGWTEMWRGVSTWSTEEGLTAARIARNTPRGEWIQGDGLYGNGFYTTPRRTTAEGYRQSNYGYSNEGFGPGPLFEWQEGFDVVEPGGILRMALNPAAKIVDYEELLLEYQEWLRTPAAQALGLASRDSSFYAVLRGYDGIRIRGVHGINDGSEYPSGVTNDHEADQYIIFNRTVLVFERPGRRFDNDRYVRGLSRA
jgi:hypothetical protein